LGFINAFAIGSGSIPPSLSKEKKLIQDGIKTGSKTSSISISERPFYLNGNLFKHRHHKGNRPSYGTGRTIRQVWRAEEVRTVAPEEAPTLSFKNFFKIPAKEKI
jgi:hypothetical protein